MTMQIRLRRIKFKKGKSSWFGDKGLAIEWISDLRFAAESYSMWLRFFLNPDSIETPRPSNKSVAGSGTV